MVSRKTDPIRSSYNKSCLSPSPRDPPVHSQNNPQKVQRLGKQKKKGNKHPRESPSGVSFLLKSI